MVSKNRKDEGSLSKLRLCNIVMSDSYWLETSKTNYAETAHNEKIGRKSSWILYALSGDDAYRNFWGINRCNLWSVKYWCSCSVSRRLAKGSHELQSTEKPSQLTKYWISVFFLRLPRWSRISSMKYSMWSRRAMSSGSTTAESKTDKRFHVWHMKISFFASRKV